MSKTISCTVMNFGQAEDILRELQSAGFLNTQISVLFPESEETKKWIQEKHTKAPEGATTGASTGGVIGGVLGWLAGIGSLAIPGVGPFIAAGPIMATLSGTAIGAAVGGLTGALLGLGFPEYEAKLYESKLKEGNILISAHTEEDEKQKRERAHKIFKMAGAKNISEMKEENLIKEYYPQPKSSNPPSHL